MSLASREYLERISTDLYDLKKKTNRRKNWKRTKPNWMLSYTNIFNLMKVIRGEEKVIQRDLQNTIEYYKSQI